MATEQDRWNQAQRNTDNVMRGTQPHVAAGQAQKTTAGAMRGTYSSDQSTHDKAYKQAMGAHLKANPSQKPGPQADVKVSQGLLKNGADPKKLQNSIAAHSQGAQRHSPTDKGKYSRDVVAVAADRNRKDDPRADRQNVKPGHEPHRGPSSNSPKYEQAKSTGQNAAYGMSEHSRNAQVAAAHKNGHSH